MKEFNLEQFISIKRSLQKKNLEITIISGSMSPVIKIGEKIEVTSIVNIQDLKLFDIIVFYDKVDKLICHFVTSISAGKVHTRGLHAYKVSDLPVGNGQVLGQVLNKEISKIRKFYILLRIFLNKI